jgi:predicted RNA-binding protein YlxR (DUF448 family)
MCAGCGKRFAKGSLVRFTVIESRGGRTVVVDLNGTRQGRGAYTCPNLNCFDKALRKKVLMKRLRAGMVAPSLRDDFKHLLKQT